AIALWILEELSEAPVRSAVGKNRCRFKRCFVPPRPSLTQKTSFVFLLHKYPAQIRLFCWAVKSHRPRDCFNEDKIVWQRSRVRAHIIHGQRENDDTVSIEG